MKLNPINTTEAPSYPSRRPRSVTIGDRIRRAAIAVGASAVMGLAACGASDTHTETPDGQTTETHGDGHNRPDDEPILPPGEPPMPHNENPEPEPAPVEEPEGQSDAQLDNQLDRDPIHMAGGRSAPVPPDPVQPPPPAPAPEPQVIVTPPPLPPVVVVTPPNGSHDQAPTVVKPPRRPDPVRTAGLVPAPRFQ